VGQLAGPGASIFGEVSLALLRVLGHGLRDGIVETSIEDLKLDGSDRRVHFIGQLCDGLADATIVLDDLGHGKATPEKISAVLGGTLGDRIGRDVREA
jgi:hypothetical protein